MPDDDSRHEPPAGAAAGERPTREQPAGEEQAEGGGDGRGWRIAAMVAVLAAMVALGALGSLLFARGGRGDEPTADVRACIPSRDFRAGAKDDGDTCPPRDATRLDGMVTRTDEGGFTIQVIEDGQLGESKELHVRPPDRPYIDIAHAQTHAALGQPIRVYLQEVDGRESVVYMEDAPLVR